MILSLVCIVQLQRKFSSVSKHPPDSALLPLVRGSYNFYFFFLLLNEILHLQGNFSYLLVHVSICVGPFQLPCFYCILIFPLKFPSEYVNTRMKQWVIFEFVFDF